MTGYSQIFNFSVLFTLNLQQFLNCSSDFSALTLVPAEVSALVNRDSLYLPFQFSNFGGHGLPCGLTTLIFPLVSFFPCYNGVTTSKLFACQTINYESTFFFLPF